MSVLPPLKRPEFDVSNVIVGSPISSGPWVDSAHLANYVRAKGSVLVPAHTPRTMVGTNDALVSTSIFRYMVKPRKTAIRRIWYLTYRVRANSNDTKTFTVRAPHTTGAALTVPFGFSPEVGTVEYVEELSAKSDLTQEISIEVTNAVDPADIEIRELYCIEQDRPSLERGNPDFAVDPNTVAGGAPIFMPAVSGASMTGIYDALENLDARRTSLFQFSTGDATQITGYTGSSPDRSVFALPHPILAAKQYRNDTTGSVVWQTYGSMNSAGTGSVHLTTNESGVDDYINMHWTTDAWSIPRVVNVDCEDLSTSDGRRGSAWDDMTFGVTGDGNRYLKLKSISVYSNPNVLDIFSGTFTRAGTGWYQITASNVSGSFLTTASSNVMRLENRADKRGNTVLLETTARTNLVSNSENLSGYTTTLAVVSASGFTAPDGGADAYHVAFSAGAGARIRTTVSTLASNDRVRISFWARSVSGTEAVRVGIVKRDGTTDISGDFILGTTWVFCEYVGSVGSGVSSPSVAVYNGSDNLARNVYVWGVMAQNEITARGNSYIESPNSAGSSVADSLTFATGRYPETFRTNGFAFTHIPYQSSTDMVNRGDRFSAVLCGFSDANNYLHLYVTSSAVYVAAVENGTQRAISSAVTFERNQALGFEVCPTNGTIRLVGFSTGNGTSTGTAFTWPGSSTFAVGGKVTGTVSGSGGRYSRHFVGL